MRRGIMASFIVLSVLLFNACCKEGLNGKIDLIITPKHHNTIIKNHVGYPDTVFVKYDAEELPGTVPDAFDTFFVGVVGTQTVECKGLKCGKYYLFVTGMDSSGPYRVKGGIAIKLKNKDKKSPVEMDVAITE